MFIILNTRYISRDIGVKKIPGHKSDLQGHPTSVVVGLLVSFDRPHTIS